MGILDALLGLGSAISGGLDDYDDNPISNILGIGDINKDIRRIGMGALGGIFGNQQPQNLPPGTISEAGAMGNSGVAQNISQNVLAPPPAQGGDITVDGPARWQPRKPTILGAIADAYLMSNGLQPAYSIFRDRRNVNEAMEGFVDSPEGALKRLARIPGHEQDAWKMYNQYQDNSRADRVEERQFGTASDKAMGRVAAMLGAATPENYKSLLPVIQRYAQARGVDISGLPEEFNEDAIALWRNGSVDVDDQIKIEALNSYRKARLGQMQQTIDNTQSYRTERLEDFDTAEAGRNNRAETAEAGRNNRSKAKEVSLRMVRDPEGNVVGVVSKSGKIAKLKAPDGGFQFFEVLPNGKLGRRIPNELAEKQKD